MAFIDFLKLLLCVIVAFVLSGWACYCIWSDSATWRNMRSFVQVEARVISSELRIRPTKSGDTSLDLRVLYAYSFGGNEFRGTDPGPGVRRSLNSNSVNNALYQKLNAAPDGMVSAWVNPNRPEDAVLDRRFGWSWAGLMFAASMVTFILAYVNWPNCSLPDLVGTTGWHPKAILALVWNLSAFPILRVALVVREHPVVWVLGTFLVAAIGVALAFSALKIYLAERHLTSRSYYS